MQIGETWNESELLRDALTGRAVRRLTARGRINQTPTYHTNSGFTADGASLAFVSVREGATWLLRADVESGELTALWRAPGIGDRSYIHRGMSLRFADVDGRGVCGNRVCMAPKSRLAVVCVERRMLAVDIRSGAARVILEDCGEDWIFGAPSVSADERHVAVCLSTAHPEMRGGAWTLSPRKPYTAYRHSLRVIRVALDGDEPAEILYEHPAPAQSAHCAFSPADPNLLYFDVDAAPNYWCGGDGGATPRIWLLDIRNRRAQPLKNKYPGPFPVHQAWLWDGTALGYHGRATAGGEYFGVCAVDGRTVWEKVFPHGREYGHLTPDATRKAFIIDGVFSTNRLQWLYWPGSGSDEPELEPICVHGTDWDCLPGQYPHPHPLADPTGKWISYTAASGGRSDIYAVKIS